MKSFFKYAAYIAAFAVVLTSCKDDEDEVDFTVPASISVVVGGTNQINVTPATETYKFESVDPSKATVNATGLVTGVSEGSTTVKVSLGKTSKDVSVTVTKATEADVILVAELSVTPASISLKIGEEQTLEVSFLPANYNEPGPFELKWESSSPAVTVDANGKVTAVDFVDDAKITVSLVKRPEVKKEVPATVSEIPIETINVSQTSLDLYLGDENVTITTTLLPAGYNVKDASLEWKSDNTAVVTVVDGEIEIVGVGTTKVTVSWKSDPNVKTEIPVNITLPPPTVLDVSQFGGEIYGLSHEKVFIRKFSELEIPGLSQNEIAESYNRDFMSYDAVTGKVTFIGETGEWDVFYSEKYKYIWINKWDEGLDYSYWIVGHGFWSVPRWHDDMNEEGWKMGDPRQLAYMKPLGNGKYEAHILLNTYHEWWSFEIEFYNFRCWGIANDDNRAFAIVDPPVPGMSEGGLARPNDAIGGERDAFDDGYYRVVLDVPAQRVSFTKVGELQ